MSKPIHPILFASFPVLFLVAHNRDVTSLSDAIVPLAITLGVVLATQLVGTAVFRSPQKIAVVVSWLALLFFSYGHFWSLLEGRMADDALLLGGWAALAVIVVVAVVRTSRSLLDLTRVLNVVAAALVAMTLVTVGADSVRAGPAGSSADKNIFGLVRPDEPRDIYYLIFDRYADAETLRRHLGFDNSAFVAHLEDRGFQVTPGSRANYQNTHMSLASSLNAEHLDSVLSDVRRPSTDLEPMFDAIARNAVARSLQAIGYRYVHVGSWAAFTASSPIADVNLESIETSELTRALYGSTMLSPLLRRDDVDADDDDETQARATRGAFGAIDDAMDVRGPKFVFAHLILPHPPYVFDRHGSFTPERHRDGNVRGYLEQVRFTNTQIRRIVDELLDVPADRQPIVIIQSDEGPYPRLGTRIPDSWADEPAEDLRVKYGILNATFLPGPRSETTVWRSITPVNSFRVVFNRYFGTTLAPLPDESYAIADNKRDAYGLVALGERVRGKPPPFAASGR